jgi:hypothetical protein
MNVRKAHGLSQDGAEKLVLAPKKGTDPENQNASPSVEDW